MVSIRCCDSHDSQYFILRVQPFSVYSPHNPQDLTQYVYTLCTLRTHYVDLSSGACVHYPFTTEFGVVIDHNLLYTVVYVNPPSPYCKSPCC